MAVDINKFITKAQNAIERRNYDLAIFNYKQALMFKPDDIDAREKLRAAQMRNFSESGTNGTVATIKAIVPIIKAIVFSKTKKNEEAIFACEDGLTINPELKVLMKTLSSCAAELGYYDVAIWQTTYLLNKFDPENINIIKDLVELLTNAGRAKEAIEYCEMIKKIDPENDIDIKMRELSASETSAIFSKGATEGARSIIKDSGEAREQEIDSQIARTDDMRLEKIAILEKKVAEKPDDYKTLIRIGDTWYNLEDFNKGYKKAKECYSKAKEIMPSDTTIAVKLGDLEIKKLKIITRKHKDAFDKTGGKDIELKKKYIAAYKKLKAYQISEYEKRVKDQPLISKFHYDLGTFYFDAKRYDDAVAEFQQSCKDPKISIQSYTYMGRSFAGMGQNDLAIDMYKKAIKGQEVFDRIRDTIYFLACAQEEAGEYQESLELFTKIFEDDITYRDIKDKVKILREKIKK